MVGCMSESSVGISAIGQLLPLLDYVDMDGAVLIAQDIASGVHLEKGRAVFPDEDGNGVRTAGFRWIVRITNTMPACVPLLSFLPLVLCVCAVRAAEHHATTAEEVALLTGVARPGDLIVLADGDWRDQAIKFRAEGTAEQPITLRAATRGRSCFLENHRSRSTAHTLS
jgi:hypothetical protein